MAASLSPDQSNQSNFGGPAAQDKGPLSSMNLGFLKSLTEKRTTRDGNPAKRRGPKPDSKPALTRRQELNRQAQRTHRERKELYIKALEDEVLRLKEIYSNISQDKERLAAENRQLRALVAQNGTPGAGASGSSLLDDSMSNPSIGYASSGSVSGGAAASSHTSAFTPPPLSARSGASPITGHQPGHHHHHHHQHSSQGQISTGLGVGGGQLYRNPGVDYDQSGIDFVLTLEKPCMDHMPWLLERGTEVGGNEPCGHALMASCPPEPFPELTPDIPFGYSNIGAGAGGDVDGQQRTWELSKGDLATLLDLSTRLNLDGEITPVMAWGMVLAHPRLAELRTKDFARLSEELGSKVRCYGFGAVMEEFEVRDALENLFSMKSEMGAVY
ncbi:AP-1-like transcription factor [Phialemonium atrogriseum]|uniref:AP-1-like transcription factor n=1 Tax=Phialemonium atrogriseum TaxID=1093897 RepID=A0AAJ0BX24_9PEZI|nr:AP-1-like transcription factor [Phialemonium atrogriseum]KAK1764704.1 AP-1-like transcription factor [Phialemonium atrogriseum]